MDLNRSLRSPNSRVKGFWKEGSLRSKVRTQSTHGCWTDVSVPKGVRKGKSKRLDDFTEYFEFFGELTASTQMMFPMFTVSQCIQNSRASQGSCPRKLGNLNPTRGGGTPTQMVDG